MSGEAPSTQQILDQMRFAMGEVPAAIEKAAGADPRMVAEQARSSAFAMPPEDGVSMPRPAPSLPRRRPRHLEPGVHHGDGEQGPQAGDCDSQALRGFPHRGYVLATQVVGNAEPVFDLVNERVFNVDR